MDGSETLLRAARQRLGDRVVLHHHDLEEPLAFLEDQSFDLAVMALVYHHIDAREQLLDEIRRVLRPGGTLLVSTTHPTSDWTYFGGSYFADDRVEFPSGNGLTINYWRMTLQKFLGEFLGAGFVLEELVEPRATEEARLADPRRYDRTHTAPTFSLSGSAGHDWASGHGLALTRHIGAATRPEHDPRRSWRKRSGIASLGTGRPPAHHGR